MKQYRIVLTLASLLASISWTSVASAQEALPTAVRPMQLSAFGGVSPVFTGLSGGKNFSIAAGADLALPNYRVVRPVIEVRTEAGEDGWGLWAWLVHPTPWLDGAVPAELLFSQPEAVLDAARRRATNAA